MAGTEVNPEPRERHLRDELGVEVATTAKNPPYGPGQKQQRNGQWHSELNARAILDGETACHARSYSVITNME
jgi:hypothetical protein